MELDEAISIAARVRLDTYRQRKTSISAADDKRLSDLRAALSKLIKVAEQQRDREAAINGAPRPRYKRCEECGEMAARHFNYRHLCLPNFQQLRQVAPFMYECPGCKQHFGKGKGPYGLARHCCHPSHPQLRRGR
jgi:hypothetical protein